MILRALICIAIFTALSLFWLTHSKNDAQPVALTEAGAKKIACVSYAPYRKPGETPFDPGHRVSESRLREDLTLLTSLTGCIRTYSSQSGLEAVPKIARELGMKVILGVWIGRDPVSNRLEIDSGIKLANQFPDTIRGLIVGNEVLLRREQTRDAMARHLKEVRQAVDIPVTYADVWEFWVKNKPLAEQVDYLTIHILPYWEDEPVGIDQAVKHVVDVFEHVQDEFPGRKMMIGETGWPSAGRQRGPAAPGRLAQAEFIRGWVAVASDKKIDYNLIESFDQPWKRALEGAMGGHWGMLDSAGEIKFPWQGEVAENPTGLQSALLGAALMLIAFVTTSLGLHRLHPFNEPEKDMPDAWPLGLKLALAAVIGLSAGALLPQQVHYLSTWNRYPAEWITSGLFAVAGLLMALLLPTLAGSGRSLAPARSAWRQWRARRQDEGGASLLLLAGSWLRLSLLAGVALFMLLHAFDARYRGFAVPLYLLPAAVMLTLWIAGQKFSQEAREERWLSLVAAVCLPFMLWHEWPENQQAITLGALVLPIAAYGLLARRNNNVVASSTAAAAGSTE